MNPQAPVTQLHVTHNWGGGVDAWIDDFCQGDRQGQNLVLKSVGHAGCWGEALALYGWGSKSPMRAWMLDRPITTTTIAHPQYTRILEEILAAYRPSAVVVSSLVGHSLDVFQHGLPTVMVAHDYYPFCPHFHPMADCRPAPSGCRSCSASSSGESLPIGASMATPPALANALVEVLRAHSVGLVAPTRGVLSQLAAMCESLSALRQQVIPHGLPQAFQPFRRRNPLREKPLAVILGRLSPRKGLDLLVEALPGLSQQCQVALVGCGPEGAVLRGCRGVVHVTPRYVRGELPGLLRELDPDLGLLLSVVPETFSYTLSELMALRIPPVATARGGFAERIQPGVNGFLFPPDAAGLLAAVRACLAQPETLAAVRERLNRLKPLSLEEMVAQYRQFLGTVVTSAMRAGAASAREPAEAPATAEIPLAVLDRLAAQQPWEDLLARMHAIFRLKLEHSPRLAGWKRPLARWVLDGGYQILKFGQRVARRPRRNAA